MQLSSGVVVNFFWGERSFSFVSANKKNVVAQLLLLHAYLSLSYPPVLFSPLSSFAYQPTLPSIYFCRSMSNNSFFFGGGGDTPPPKSWGGDAPPPKSWGGDAPPPPPSPTALQLSDCQHNLQSNSQMWDFVIAIGNDE